MCVYNNNYYYYYIIILEYCGSRAVPSVSKSQYLHHIGETLHPNIDIMWTGNILEYTVCDSISASRQCVYSV